MIPIKALSITQAGAVAALTTIVGFLVAFVPSIAQWQSDIISIGGAVIAVAFLVANAVHAHAFAKIAVAHPEVLVKPTVAK